METQSLIPSMEMWFFAFSLIAAGCLIAGRAEKPKSNMNMVGLLATNGLYMFAEALAWLFDGQSSALARGIVVASNFLAFFAQYGMIAMLAFFIRSIVREAFRKKINVKLTYVIVGMVLLSEILLIISQFTGWFYYVDSNNCYQRGPYFLLSQVIGFATVVVALFTLFVYKRILRKFTVFAMTVFIISPLVAMVYQFFHYGFSFVGLATTMSVLLLFIAYEMETQKRFEKENRRKLRKLEYKL